ncbi:SMI1/KNR4 family protein [Saccharopolyspora tripterygii]
MLGPSTRALLESARGPLGPKVAVNFGSDHAPLQELGELLSEMNGFFAFNAGVQIFRVSEEGVGPELSYWNTGEAWKDSFEGLADDYFCFGQDVLGMQFAIKDGSEVVRFDPETARAERIGDSLDSWASWLMSNPNTRGTATLARVWQDNKGALDVDQRLVPRKFFEFGGKVSLDNLVVKNAVEAMRIRGPIATQIHDLPPGTEIRINP